MCRVCGTRRKGIARRPLFLAALVAGGERGEGEALAARAWEAIASEITAALPPLLSRFSPMSGLVPA